MSEHLKDRTAIVTGGSRGIGEAIAQRLAEEGAQVVIASRRQEGLDEAAKRINATFDAPRVHARACHVGRPEAIEELVAWTEAELGLTSILINNAGTNPYFGPLLGASRAAWDKTFEVNLVGPFELSRAVAQRLMKAGQPGAIINVSSILGMGASPLQGIYGMTKAALISMTRTMAQELGQAGIRVNAIAPGLVDTKLASALVKNADLTRRFTERTGVGRIAQPAEMAGVCAFLASDEASYITGQVFPIDGGYTVM